MEKGALFAAFRAALVSTLYTTHANLFHVKIPNEVQQYHQPARSLFVSFSGLMCICDISRLQNPHIFINLLLGYEDENPCS